ncbi:MAG: hypothetical protein F4X97_01335 [Boseongicola sp. SB0662_bin_57]|nr:hypothetical protein [Boseongicola sp. SB0662_bin_57]
MRGTISTASCKAGAITSRRHRPQEAPGPSADAVKLALNRLRKRGKIASPAHGFSVIVPPEYSAIGCLPADQFVPQLMANLDLPYYAGLLTAAQYYGAAHHRPQEFQVFTEKSRRPAKCGRVRVRFIARKQARLAATRPFNTPRGTLTVSTPEVTAIDLTGYPDHAGGLGQSITVLSELVEQIDPNKLVAAAQAAPLSWAQRLGYLLERADARQTAHALQDYVRSIAKDYTPLSLRGPKDGPHNKNWKIIVNEVVEPEI